MTHEQRWIEGQKLRRLRTDFEWTSEDVKILSVSWNEILLPENVLTDRRPRRWSISCQSLTANIVLSALPGHEIRRLNRRETARSRFHAEEIVYDLPVSLEKYTHS